MKHTLLSSLIFATLFFSACNNATTSSSTEVSADSSSSSYSSFQSVSSSSSSSAASTLDEDGYTLFAPMRSTETYLIDKDGEKVHTWQSAYRPGLSVYLLENGELLRSGNANNTSNIFSGSTGTGGIIEILDWDSNILWSKTLSDETTLSHHDVEELPNGNILAIVWEAKTQQEALEMGRNSLSSEYLWVDTIYEICRASESNPCEDGEVVWKWSIWDHLVQDEDSSITTTYNTSVANAPDKIDLNYFNQQSASDWTHINSVDYNEESDQILLSVHNFNEYWVIDHSDSSKGLLYRAGNPAAYGTTGEKILYAQHDAQWIEKGLPGEGNILLFNNGSHRSDGDYSSVDEYCYANSTCNAGDVISTYSEGPNGNFYAMNISGAQRLSNGNTLVCEGTTGRFFEYNADKEIVWEYNYGDVVFRATRYEKEYSGLEKL